jgi:hypothetical protein
MAFWMGPRSGEPTLLLTTKLMRRALNLESGRKIRAHAKRGDDAASASTLGRVHQSGLWVIPWVKEWQQ